MSCSKPNKIFQDSIQGIIEVEPILMRFIDTPEFQRLRRLHQLGLVYYVYPDCTHTRFEHSLGTYHLARRLIDAMQADLNCATVRLSIGERMSVLIAALCHDLGHGPLSHTWEHFLRQGGPEYKKIKHEDLSCMIVRRIVSKDKLLQDLLERSEADLDLVCALICGHPTPELSKGLQKKQFIFEIVSNSLNGNDVDKWDYIMRDSLHAGLGQGSSVIEVERMLRFYRPAYHAPDDSWHMAFRSSEIVNVLRVFSQRQLLNHKVYSHKTVRALEAMFIDIFNDLDSILHLRDLSLRAAAGDGEALDAFLQLDEHSLWTIASSQSPWPCQTLPVIKACLRSSTQLCRRIELRQLYYFVGKFYAIERISITNGHCSPEPDNISDLSRLVSTTLLEAEVRPKDAIELKVLGSEAQILAEIFSRLPPESPVRNINELRCIVATQSSNSTNAEPVFFVYNTLPNAFCVRRSANEDTKFAKVHCYVLLWTGAPDGDYDSARSLEGPKPVPPCLIKALNSWLCEIKDPQSPLANVKRLRTVFD